MNEVKGVEGADSASARVAVVIRAASPEDARAIAEVHVHAWKTTYVGQVPDEFLASRDPGRSERIFQRVLAAEDSNVFVADSGGRIVGFASASRRRFPEHVATTYEAQIPAIYILAEHQRGGLGTRLLAAAAQWLLDSGSSSLVIWALESNMAARQFYEKLGGELLPDRLTDDARGFPMNEVAYGWKDLRRLTYRGGQHV